MSTLHLSVGQNLSPPPAENSSNPADVHIMSLASLPYICIFSSYMYIFSLSLSRLISIFLSIYLLTQLSTLFTYLSIYLSYLSFSYAYTKGINVPEMVILHLLLYFPRSASNSNLTPFLGHPKTSSEKMTTDFKGGL